MVLLFYIGAVHHTVVFTAKCGQQILLTGDILMGEYAALRSALLHGLMVALLTCQNLKSNGTIKGDTNPV